MEKQHPQRGPLGQTAPAPFWRVVTLPTLAAALLVASMWLYLRTAQTPAERPVPLEGRAAWEPATEDERLVDAFRKARNEDAESTLHLAPDPVFDGKPVSEAEGEALQAAYLLRRVRQIVGVRAGEPGQGSAWLNTPGRYTLATHGGGSTPKVAVKVGNRVEAPASLFVIDPDIVVEVRDGLIQALRAEMHRD
jgi:hypothetical protein